MTNVLKSSGDLQPFDEAKLRRSLERAGAGPDDVVRVVGVVRTRLREGMPTKELYRTAFRALRGGRKGAAARYSLKRAVLDLGPTGHPFERMMGAVIATRGYSVAVGVELQGRLVRHEVDVVAEKDEHRVLVECKHHSSLARKCDLKVALYVHARALDLLVSIPRDDAEFWLVTNTRFTTEAARYGDGVGLRLVSWDHPPGRSLPTLIEEAGVHPLTCLSSLKNRQKQRLLDRGLVLARDLDHSDGALDDAGVRGGQAERVRAELEGLRVRSGSGDS